MAVTSNTYTANGSTVDFAFTFPYQNTSDIKVSVDEVVQTLTTHYTLHNATTIRFGTAPADTTKVKIYRDTASNQLAATFYPGSAIRSNDLNDNYTQNLYVTQEAENDAAEALDNSRVLESGAYVSAITKASNAVTTANTADTNATNAVNTANTASASATNAVNTANTANTTAGDAVTTANSAVTTANNAVTTANGAVTTANTANTTAGDAETKADNAVSTANTANTTAGNAVTTANAADAIADEAKLATDRVVATTSDGGNTWTLKGNNTNASTDPKGVGYAVAQAEAAVITANSASATVAQSAIYQVVADFAALPSLNTVDNDKFYQINDSTLVQNESTVSGAPAGFTGDDELAVKLKSDTVSSPKVWVWQEYYATDPETRYRKKLIVENLTTISEDYTIGTGNNGFSIGPVTISANKTITIPANSKYVVMN